ncbi:hypothetical protein IGI37_000983 [Enterococcus sp. AZ194]
MKEHYERENKKLFRKRRIDYAINVMMFFYLVTLFYSLIFNFPLFSFLFMLIVLTSVILFLVEGKRARDFDKLYKEKELKNRSTFSRS